MKYAYDTVIPAKNKKVFQNMFDELVTYSYNHCKKRNMIGENKY